MSTLLCGNGWYTDSGTVITAPGVLAYPPAPTEPSAMWAYVVYPAGTAQTAVCGFTQLALASTTTAGVQDNGGAPYTLSPGQIVFAIGSTSTNGDLPPAYPGQGPAPVVLTAAKRHQLHRVGFGTRHLDFFTADWSSAAVRKRHRHTFNSQQMAALTAARASSDKLRVLLVQGKFTRAQAKLLIAEGVV